MYIDTTTYNKSKTKPIGYGYGPVVENGPARRANSDIESIIVHTTNGKRGSTFAAEAGFLATTKDVSSHYLVGKNGQIVQIVDDAFIAWHAGTVTETCFNNTHSIGIENHFTPGEAWTDAMHGALTELVAALLQKYPSITRIETHRAVATPRGRKQDPSGWDDASFYAWRNALLAQRGGAVTTPLVAPKNIYTSESSFIGTATTSISTARSFIMANNAACQYTSDDIGHIVHTYADACVSVGLDWWLVLCQALHETGRFSSWWCAPPRRNFAGLGVTGETSTQEQDSSTWFYDDGKHLWIKGLCFDEITPIENKSCAEWAHIGHLLAYIYTDAEMTPQQRALSAMSPRKQAIPASYRGTVKTIKGLTQRWAVSKVLPPEPKQYHNRIIAIANSV